MNLRLARNKDSDQIIKLIRKCLKTKLETKVDIRLYLAIFENGLPKSPLRL